MQNKQESIDIVARFHEAIQRLIDDKKIRGKQTFTTRYGIDKRALYGSARDHRAGYFEIGWLAFLANDFQVSPEWLLTGKGRFYKMPKAINPKSPKIENSCANFAHPDII